ncbi:AAA family ATPase [Paenarthrobacter sp. NPDC089675]|uniref:helix-turn-helix transcriptional regulator n=1 Tax=Paenarthrobacter sp. NPDC089675 TaxID=3364376 RepID=UPI0037F1996F
MTVLAGQDAPRLVGREEELAQLVRQLEGLKDGTSRTILVLGDAGIGKTALVAAVRASVPDQYAVLAGAALPLKSLDIHYHALRSAFRSADSLASPRPFSPGAVGTEAPQFIDQWIESVTARRPLLLAIDDLQWADADTLDMLMFIIAGPVDRPLGIVGTVRSEAVVDGCPLQGWLADVKRLPNVSLARLGPLDRPASANQIASLLGYQPAQSLVSEIFGHSAGNPYFTRLLVEGLDVRDGRLPTGFPADLRDAVLRSWQGLSTEGRRLTQILALGGNPAPLSRFAQVAKASIPGIQIRHELDASMAAGIVELERDGTYWFRHPLIPEVLELETAAEDRLEWHAAFARVYEEALDSQTGDAQASQSLANHYFNCGRWDAALRWTLVAASHRESNGEWPEALELLERAVDLHSRARQAPKDMKELWERVRTAAFNSGDFRAELRAIESLLTLADPAREPLGVAALLVRRMHLRMSVGESFLDLADVVRAGQLAAGDPLSWQYVLASAETIHVRLWKDQYRGVPSTSDVVSLARRVGDHRALSFALTASAMERVFAGDPRPAVGLAREAAAEALTGGDYWAYCHAVAWLGNAEEGWVSRKYGEIMRSAREELAQARAPHSFMSKIAADEAASFLAVGSWRDAKVALRTAVSFDPGPMGDVSGRLTMARLDALQGRTQDAFAHLGRAEEVNRDSDAFVNLGFAAVRSELNVIAGRSSDALDVAVAAASRPGPPPTMCEWLLPLAARALADMVQDARDSDLPTAALLDAAADLKERFPVVLTDAGALTPLYASQIKAFNMLYDAEIGRARNQGGTTGIWVLAADACKEASLAWEEAYACQRAAETILLRGRGKGNAVEILKRGLALARELQATPVETALRVLADRSRIPLASEAARRPSTAPAHWSLTPREAVILEHLVAGKTYREIATALFISEKTVSSHISSVLRKAGAANRIDLARKVAGAQSGQGT